MQVNTKLTLLRNQIITAIFNLFHFEIFKIHQGFLS